LTQALLYGGQVTLGMMLMLVWMTYNAWLCAAMVGGAIVGYILFGHTPAPSGTDSMGQTTICH
jgi:copper transporter 1